MVALARLLDPAAFGLMAMTTVVLRFATYFAQMGVGQALVQLPELSSDHVGAAFWASLGLGGVFFLVTWILAPLAASAFAEQRLVPLVRAAAASFVLAGFGITATSLLRRNIRFKQLALVEVGSLAVGSGIVGISCAYHGLGVWSLVAGFLVRSLVASLLAYALSPHTLSLPRNPSAFRSLYSLGSRYSLITFLEFLAANLDTMIIGRLAGNTTLGLYNRAHRLAYLPVEFAVTSVTKVVFPVFSRLQAQREKFQTAYLSTLMTVGVFSSVVSLSMAPAAEEIVTVLLGPQWTQSTPILRMLVLAVPLTFMAGVSSLVLDASAALNIRLAIQSVLVVCTGAFLLLLRSHGAVGFAAAVVFSQLAGFAAFTFTAFLRLRLPWRRGWKTFAAVGAAAVTAGIAVFGTTAALRFRGTGSWATLGGQILAGGVVLAAAGLPILRHFRQIGVYPARETSSSK